MHRFTFTTQRLFEFFFRSNDIRWAFDLRWQDPSKPNGREDESEKMPLMRSLHTPVEAVDWSVLVNRQHVDQKSFLNEQEAKAVLADEFDTRIHGAWMKRWPIKYHSKHTRM